MLKHRQEVKYPSKLLLYCFRQGLCFPHTVLVHGFCVTLYVKADRDTLAMITSFPARNESESQGRTELPLESISLK